MGIEIAKPKKVEELLNDEEFCRKWTDLYAKCPWATVFQDIQYLQIWHRHFKESCETYLIYETDENDDLIGMFPLSQCNGNQTLFISGDYHSEYQTWLATSENGNEFAEKAFDLAAKEFPKLNINLMYLAPNTPIDWLDGKWKNQTILQSTKRPLINLQGKNTSAKSLRKKGNKTRIRQLKKRGELSFEEIKSVDEFANNFDEIENYSHLRVSGIHNVQFDLDERRKQFHIDLMRETDFLYPTVLKVGEEIASSQVCFRNKDEMLLCVTSMSPFFAKQSPSKIHLLMIGNELTNLGYKYFDLSPGPGYKERFANEIGDSKKLKIFFDKPAYIRAQAKRKFLKFGRQTLEKANIQKTNLCSFADKLIHKLKRIKLSSVPTTVLQNIQNRIYKKIEVRMYSMDISQIDSLENPNMMAVDSVSDLLKYKPQEAWQDTTSQFHQKVIRRFEQGTRSFSLAQDGELLHYGWMHERQDVSYVYEVEQSFNLPKNTGVIFDYYTSPKARNKGLYQKSILQGLHAMAKIPDTEQVFIGVMADNAPSRHTIEKLGFKYEGSLFKETRFGFVKKWQNWNNDSLIEEKEFVLEESYSV